MVTVLGSAFSVMRSEFWFQRSKKVFTLSALNEYKEYKEYKGTLLTVSTLMCYAIGKNYKVGGILCRAVLGWMPLELCIM